MSTGKTGKRSPLLSGIVIVILISVTAVMAYRHYSVPAEPVMQEDTISQAPEHAVEASVKDAGPSTNMETYRENLEMFGVRPDSEKRNNDRKAHMALSDDKDDQRKTVRKSSGVAYGKPQVARNAAPNVPARAVKNRDAAPANNHEGVSQDLRELASKKTSPNIVNNAQGNAADHNVSIRRDIVSGSFDAGQVNVMLSINVESTSPNGLIIQEYVPKGWEVQSSIPLYRTFNSETGEIKWLFIGSDVGNMKINYKIVKTEDSAGMLSLSGNYLYTNPGGGNVNKQINGPSGT